MSNRDRELNPDKGKNFGQVAAVSAAIAAPSRRCHSGSSIAAVIAAIRPSSASMRAGSSSSSRDSL